MYKVLLVDDEADVREGLLLEMDWKACGFIVSGVAENGKEALELMESLDPDVVITDISMPFMNGLELAGRLRTLNPLLKLVILTGYDEFDYARQAVRLHVDEYLLKPFSSDTLRDLLLRIRQRIEEEMSHREDIRRLQEHYRISLPMLGESFLASLLTRRLPKALIAEKARSYGLRLNGHAYVVAAIALHSPEEEASPGPGQSLRASGDVDLMLHAMLNIAKEIWDAERLGSNFIYQNHIVLLAVGEGDEAWHSRLQGTLDNVLRSIDHFLKLPITIGVGSAVTDASHLKHSFTDALLALDYRLVLGSGKVIDICDVERRDNQHLRLDELKEQALIRSLKVGTAEELAEVVERLFADLHDASFAYSDIQLYLLEVVTAVLRTAKDAGVQFDTLFWPGFQLHSELFNYADLREMQSGFYDICSRIMGHIASYRQSAYKELVEKAIRYTKENYMDASLSIQKVCVYLHISAGYFSSVFKKEVKVTYGQYLMSIRMEAAKELLRATELKAFEIAERVGFADPNYFSFCFKKGVGVSPKEYRSRSLSGEPSHP
ncbi:response regulator [Paenibacillus sp. GCM10012307]|uniref:Response regulator n=1 Tax=Paenibacillus roseus TaxID=2798579 RepID=A0A934MR08_9BACL|nr:response regulator [Paenibacillus roseus]MBJ6362423.1 response regulator [Paenibacillus roseus]